MTTKDPNTSGAIPSSPPSSESVGARIRDHPIIVVLGLCAASLGAGWVGSEKLRVDPLERQVVALETHVATLEAQVRDLKAALQEQRKTSISLKAPTGPDKDAPVITRAYVTEVRGPEGSTVKFDQNIDFYDPNGDAVFLSYVVLRTTAADLTVQTSSIRTPKDEQMKLATHHGRWDCGTGSYSLTLRAIISDSAGHVSEPMDYVINCNR